MPEIVVTLDIGGSGVKASCFDPAETSRRRPPSCATHPQTPRMKAHSIPNVWAKTAIAALAQLVACCLPSLGTIWASRSARSAFPLCSSMLNHRVVGPSLLNRDRRALPIVTISPPPSPTQAPLDELDTGSAGVRPA